MTLTALSALLALSFAVQDADVDEAAQIPPPASPQEEAAPPPPVPPDEGPAADADDDEDDVVIDDEDGEEPEANYGAAIGSAAACAPADALIGALFGACGLCLLTSSQSSNSLSEGIGAACALLIACPASLAVGIVPPVAALAGGCLGALAGDGNMWGAALGAVPGVLVGLGGFALIVTGLALGTQTEGQGRDVLAPWPLAPSSPVTAPDSLAYTAGVAIAVLAGPIAVVGAGLGGMTPTEDDDDEGDEKQRETAAWSQGELQLAGASPDDHGTVAW